MPRLFIARSKNLNELLHDLGLPKFEYLDYKNKLDILKRFNVIPLDNTPCNLYEKNGELFVISF